MEDLKVTVVYLEHQTLYGIWQKSSDKVISRDIKSLSETYHKAVSMPKGRVLPYFVLSRNYDERSKEFELFIGSVLDKCGLERFELPAGAYAKITVKPKLGFLWGASIGQAKRFFYTKWLKENPYEALNMEYEHHTEKSAGTQKEIDIMFAVQRAGEKG